VEVLTALGERDATIAATEQRTGAGLQAMINDEHVTVPETAQWCVGTLSRLRGYLFLPARRFASPADLRTPRLQFTNQ
jgi:hypothetical protein